MACAHCAVNVHTALGLDGSEEFDVTWTIPVKTCHVDTMQLTFPLFYFYRLGLANKNTLLKLQMSLADLRWLEV